MKEKILQNPHLDGSTFSLEGSNNIGIILIHGFTATTIEVKPFAEFLNGKGYSVYCPLLPGHGTSPDELNKVTWQDWITAVEQIIQLAGQNHSIIFLGGESMGGVIACFLAEQYPDIRGLLLFAPALKVDFLNLSQFIRLFKKFMPKKNIKEIPEDGKFPWQGYKVNPTQAAYQFYLLQKITKKKLNLITQPAIIFQGKLDQTISPDSSNFLYNEIKSEEKELLLLEKSEHCVLLDIEFDFIARKSLDFIQKHSLH